jgi:hypothetical protein
MHDVQQLEELGLVGSSPQGRGITFWPTTDGRTAVHNAAELLERRSETAASADEATRLRRWAEKLRAGDVTVGVVAGAVTAAIRALMGF